jgi:hypothetical protein
VGRGLRLLVLVLELVLVCGTILTHDTDVGVVGWRAARTRVLVLVGGKCVMCRMCVVAVVFLEGVRLTMVTMSVLVGRSRALAHRT